jgi:hypothetical protein
LLPSLRTWARLVARLLVGFTLVLGLSLGLAWAWDRSDTPAAQSGAAG